jgi:hypothetical protein
VKDLLMQTAKHTSLDDADQLAKFLEENGGTANIFQTPSFFTRE